MSSSGRHLAVMVLCDFDGGVDRHGWSAAGAVGGATTRHGCAALCRFERGPVARSIIMCVAFGLVIVTFTASVLGVLGSAVSILGAMWIARTGINAFHAVTVAVAVVLVITSALGFASVNAKSRPGLTVFSHVCFILALVQITAVVALVVDSSWAIKTVQRVLQGSQPHVDDIITLFDSEKIFWAPAVGIFLSLCIAGAMASASLAAAPLRYTSYHADLQYPILDEFANESVAGRYGPAERGVTTFA
ncbi:Transmembrane protein [Plasmodiophora brassicae]|uniref:Transmembrane protein n=1 Tax=Plasmodiophora brassicae TaxID=37360 RepID=A0A0G4IM35_PLABS|nr:hypothetical protein PBRA_004982 [Plasmodiophora brassicae]SPQ99250.1 unnamed protein product [Plasmodiophora brassicae]